MQKTNFITQLIFSDKADSLFVITLGLSMHVWPHPLEATNFYCFHEPLVTSKIELDTSIYLRDIVIQI